MSMQISLMSRAPLRLFWLMHAASAAPLVVPGADVDATSLVLSGVNASKRLAVASLPPGDFSY